MSRKAKPEEPWEYRRPHGQTTLTIYPVKPSKSRPHGGYVFRYRIGGKERTVERADREKSLAEADRIAIGLAQTGEITVADMEAHVHTTAVLDPDDPPLHAIVAEWKSLKVGTNNASAAGLAARRPPARLALRSANHAANGVSLRKNQEDGRWRGDCQ